MKSKLLLLPLALILFSCNKDIKHLNFDKKIITINVNNEYTTNEWEITPNESVSINEIECFKATNEITLTSDLDELMFNLGSGDTVNLKLIQNKKDTFLTQFIGVKPNVYFPEEYINEHKGKVTVEIPEVSELANILVALHKDAERDQNMTESRTAYFKRVKEYFKPFLNHPMIDTVEKHIDGLRAVTETDTIFSDESYLYYITFKMNACTYYFDEENNIVNNGIVRNMSKGWSSFDPMKDVALMTDFANKSNFRKFYQQNKPYYDSLLITYNSLNPIDKMEDWLDSKFNFTYGNYVVYFSPLVNGAHSAQKFTQSDFNQSIMFISGANYDANYSKVMNELLEGRVVFTELDHNYVNPVSDRYSNEINKAIINRETWIKGDANALYENSYMIFNEYMTFAVYSLYSYDNFDEKNFYEYLPMLESTMEVRGFIQFKAWNREMLNTYISNKNISIDELYKHMLEWAGNMK